MKEAEAAPGADSATRWIGRIVPPLLRGLYCSWRVRCEGLEAIDAELAAGRRVILAVWHGHLLTCLPHFGPRYAPHVMISRSRDGTRVSAVAAALGVVPVRGSSSRGGVRALLQAVQLLKKGHVVGHVVDGPRGPGGEIKPGLLLMAQRSGATIVPMYVASGHHWTATRSWDRMQIPLPGSRVLFRAGTPHRVAPDLDEPGLEATQRLLTAEMREGYTRANADVLSR